MACSGGRAGVLTTRAAVLAGRDLGSQVLSAAPARRHRTGTPGLPAFDWVFGLDRASPWDPIVFTVKTR